jgi:hypothetical protein
LLTIGTGASPSAGTGTNYFNQKIEGLNVADLGWGTANAQTVTLSFWVRSSLTGNFGVCVSNDALNTSYPASYTISSANTWEFKTITVPGPTSGTFPTNNTGSLRVLFDWGNGSDFKGPANTWASADYRGGASGTTNICATSGATWFITGVQLERGQTATSFDVLPYTTELALCQRYYWKVTATGYYPCIGLARGTTITRNMIAFPVPMRVVPTSLSTTGTASDYALVGNVSVTCSSVPTLNDTTTTGGVIGCTVSSGLTDGYPYLLNNNASPNSFLAWSAEL